MLLLRQTQEHPTSAHCNTLVQHQTALLVPEATPTFNQLNDFVGGGEVQTLGQGSLQVGLQELALPAVTVLKEEVHPEQSMSRTAENLHP